MTPFVLHLLRHGAPDVPDRMMGRTDGAPTRAGIDACVKRAAAIKITALIASDLRRTRETAEVISAAYSLPLTIDPRWRELDFGAWDGLAAAEIDRAALERFWADPDANPPPNGECWTSLVGRIAAALGVLSARPTLVVTHGGAIRAALKLLCGFSQPQLWAFDLPYASLLTLRVWPGDAPSAQVVGLQT